MSRVASVGDGRYELREHIASGGMGEVWRATDTSLGREVAVKILKAGLGDDAAFRGRLQAEARNTAGLHHPGIAQVFDYGDTAQPGSEHAMAYLVMELVPGEPLSAVLERDGALAPHRAADIVAQAATAIDAAHAHGVVHRDVMPANLLVMPDGTVKVTDFGIARAGDAVPLTQSGQVLGTPHYISPEQATGERGTAASDIYSLGVVLYECLSGHRPFSGEVAVALAMQHLSEPVPPLPPSVPDDLAAVCMRAMAKDPAHRVKSAGELAAHLREPESAPPLQPHESPAAGGSVARGAAAGGPAAGRPAAGGPAAGAVGAGAVGSGAAAPVGDTATMPAANPGDAAPGHAAPGRAAPGHAAPVPPRRRPQWLLPVLAAAAVFVLVGVVAFVTGDEPAGSTPGTERSTRPSPVSSGRQPADGSGGAGAGTGVSGESKGKGKSDQRGRGSGEDESDDDGED